MIDIWSRKSMKAVVVDEPGKLEVKDIPMAPRPAPGEVTVAMRAAGICGSDLHVYHGRSAFAKYPRVLGHELAGEITCIGEGCSLGLGEHVVIDPLSSCGKCYACRIGRYNVCRDLKVMAAHVDGGFAEYVTVPESKCHIIDKNIPWEHAACAEPYTIAAEATSRGRLQADDTVLICGAGPIGLVILQVVKKAGAKALVIDMEGKRLERAKALGADAVCDTSKEDADAVISDYSCGEGCSLIFEATGSLKVLEDCIAKWASPAGRLVMLGFSSEPAEIAPVNIMKRELDVLGSRLSLNKFPSVVKWIEEGYVDPSGIITHVFPFEDAVSAFRQIMDDPGGTAKVILKF